MRLRWNGAGALQETPAISVITVMELLQGCRDQREQRAVERLTARTLILHLDATVCERAVDYFRTFRLSHGLGMLDAFIASTAATYELTLCSFNRRHYSVIPDLQILTPYERTR